MPQPEEKEKSPCSLEFAVVCLRRALETVRGKAAEAQSAAAAGPESLEQAVLLRLVFVFLRLRDAHCAADTSQQLLSLIDGETSAQTRYF